MTDERIRIDVPASDARRDRVEREVFGRLAAIRTVDRADSVAPRPRMRRLIYALPMAAALAIVLVIVVRREHTEPRASTPSLVVTPVGGSSRFTVGDAVIDAAGDTSVKVQEADDAVVLVLDRGSIDCDVTPRNGRPPFRVVAGDVEVEVIGTRFAVSRIGAGARVDVIRGKVRVHAPAGERFLTAGESWTPSVITASVLPSPPIVVTPAVPSKLEETAPATARTTPIDRPAPAEAYRAVAHLAAKDPRKATREYRTIANGGDAWAALALFDLAELHATSDPRAALRELDELARRFPRAANSEDAAWLRVDVHRRAGQLEEARRAAADYLRTFPQGTYVRQAARLAP